ncbi:hypothetical protein NIES2111_62220 (plasmid) [Nostoc sp. NIES-2111]|nr:hypothetical protein NIES2111_62220 [Nostoc sp. NIES-2111]
MDTKASKRSPPGEIQRAVKRYWENLPGALAQPLVEMA